MIRHLNFTLEKRIFLHGAVNVRLLYCFWTNSVEQPGIKRLYYSIGEVSNLVDEEQYVLRYWETEFEALRPQKNRAGNRIYNDRDIEIIRTIQQLLRIRRFTIDGAKEHLKTLYFPIDETEHPETATTEPTSPMEGTSDAAHHITPTHHEKTTEHLPESASILVTNGVSESHHATSHEIAMVTSTITPTIAPSTAAPHLHAFSRTVQAESLNTTETLSSILTLPSPTETPIEEPSEHFHAETPITYGEASAELDAEQATTSLLEADTAGILAELVLPEQPPQKTDAVMLFNRAELLSLRDALRQVLNLLESPPDYTEATATTAIEPRI